MKNFVQVSVCRRRFLRLGLVASILTSIRAGLGASDDEGVGRQYFNVPEGKALETLKLAVKQANVEIMLSAETVKGVRTKKVIGSFTLIEVFDRMLSGTPLIVVRHEESGVYMVKNTNNSKRNARLRAVSIRSSSD